MSMKNSLSPSVQTWVRTHWLRKTTMHDQYLQSAFHSQRHCETLRAAKHSGRVSVLFSVLARNELHTLFSYLSLYHRAVLPASRPSGNLGMGGLNRLCYKETQHAIQIFLARMSDVSGSRDKRLISVRLEHLSGGNRHFGELRWERVWRAWTIKMRQTWLEPSRPVWEEGKMKSERWGRGNGDLKVLVMMLADLWAKWEVIGVLWTQK